MVVVVLARRRTGEERRRRGKVDKIDVGKIEMRCINAVRERKSQPLSPDREI
jgi:hypothetical protein